MIDIQESTEYNTVGDRLFVVPGQIFLWCMYRYECSCVHIGMNSSQCARRQVKARSYWPFSTNLRE